MSKLGKRERLERRKRKEALATLSLVRKEQVRLFAKRLEALPKRERLLLQGYSVRGGSVSYPLDVNNVKAHSHYKGCWTGKGYADAKGRDLNSLISTSFSKPLGSPKKRDVQDRFATGFMALGHEGLTTHERGVDLEMVKGPRAELPKAKKWVKITHQE